MTGRKDGSVAVTRATRREFVQGAGISFAIATAALTQTWRNSAMAQSSDSSIGRSALAPKSNTVLGGTNTIDLSRFRGRYDPLYPL